MAAAEYYNPGGGRQPSPAVQPPRIQASSHYQSQPQNALPYPISDAPPPYTPYVDNSRPHSQPPPQNRVRFDDQPRPPVNSYNSPGQRPAPPVQSYNSNEKLRPPPVSHGYPTSHPPTPQQYPPPQPNGYYQQGPPPSQPSGPGGYADPYAYRGNNLSPQPHYPRERSRSRSHDRRHRHHHSHRHREESQQKKKGSGVNTFLGAGGGAIIGDAIFPGLGTLGGAILGGLGGHEYTKQRKSYGGPSRMGRRSYSSAEADYYDDDYGRGRKH